VQNLSLKGNLTCQWHELVERKKIVVYGFAKRFINDVHLSSNCRQFGACNWGTFFESIML
jgi:hypothetical protein